MKIVSYLSKKFHSVGGTPLEFEVYKYLNVIEVCSLAKNNPLIYLPPEYQKLIKDLDL